MTASTGNARLTTVVLDVSGLHYAAMPHDLLGRAQSSLVRRVGELRLIGRLHLLHCGGAVRLRHRIAEVIRHRLAGTVVSALFDPAPSPRLDQCPN